MKLRRSEKIDRILIFAAIGSMRIAGDWIRRRYTEIVSKKKEVGRTELNNALFIDNR